MWFLLKIGGFAHQATSLNWWFCSPGYIAKLVVFAPKCGGFGTQMRSKTGSFGTQMRSKPGSFGTKVVVFAPKSGVLAPKVVVFCTKSGVLAAQRCIWRPKGVFGAKGVFGWPGRRVAGLVDG